MPRVTKAQKQAYRTKFIKDFTRSVCSMTGKTYEKLSQFDRSCIELVVCQIMDTAIHHRKKLDVKFDDGYLL